MADLSVIKQQNRLRAEQQHQQQMLRQTPGMVPGGLNNYEHMIRFQQANGMQINGDLRQKALQNNNRNAFGQPYVILHRLENANIPSE